MNSEWASVALDPSIVTLKSGFAFAKSKLLSNGLPHLRPFNIGLDGEIDDKTVYFLPQDHGKDLTGYQLKVGDVLFNNTSSVEIVGKSALVRAPLNVGFSNHVTRIRVIDQDCLRPAWLALCLRSLWATGYFRREANRWIGQAGFAPTRLKDVHIPLPPADTQDRLVEEYERTTADCQGALELLRSTSALATSLLPSLLGRVTQRLPNGRRPLADVMAEPLRNGWSPVCDNDPSGTPVLTLGAVLGFTYQPRAFKRTSEPADAKAGYWLREGDLLISRSNTAELVGHAAIYSGDPSPCIFPDLLIRLRFDPAVADPDFVLLWLQSREVRSYIKAKAVGASPTMQKINQTTVRGIPFPDIDVGDQQALASELETVIDDVELASELMADAEELVAQFDASLLRQLVPVIDSTSVDV